MASLTVELVPALSDNYVYLIHDPATGASGVVDPAEAAPVEAALARAGRKLDVILNTHHHGDHTGGNAALKAAFRCPVLGPAGEVDKIPTIDRAMQEGDVVTFGSLRFFVIDTPGHTKGHVSLWCREAGVLFCGDTLFSLGCGRLLEGTFEQMWDSLLKLRTLPDETLVYCGHEYTQSNARFATTIDPGNAALAARAEEVDRLRRAGSPTIPARLGDEKATNPFLRADDPTIAQAVGLVGARPADVFTMVRRAKDNF
jgi:hydroxyacylglutathione hydrolase